MAVDCTFFRVSIAFTVCVPFYSEDGSGLLILLLINGFHDGFRAVFLRGWGRIAPSSSRRQLLRRFAHSIAPRMAVDCSYLHSPMAFTMVFALNCSVDGSVLLILLLAKSFHDGLCVVLISGWYRIAPTTACQLLSRRFARRIALPMAPDCSIFCSPTAFTTVYTPYCSADSIGLPPPPLANGFHDELHTVLHPGWCGGSLILSLVNSFHDGLRTVLGSGWQRIAHTSARQRLSRQFVHRITHRMAVDCSYLRSSMAFMMVFVLYCSADGSVLLIHPFANSFLDGLHAILLSGWYRIARSSACQQLSRRFARRIALQMAVDCSYLRSPTAFTMVFVPNCSVDNSVLLILPLNNSFHDGMRVLLLSGWYWIAPTSAYQRLSRRFARCIALLMAVDCSIFRSPTAFMTVCAPYCSADGIGLPLPPHTNGFHDDLHTVFHTAWRGGSLILSLVNGFYDGLCAILLCVWQRIAHTSTRQQLSRQFTRRIAQRMAADCSYLRSSTAFLMVFVLYFSAWGVWSKLKMLEDFW